MEKPLRERSPSLLFKTGSKDGKPGIESIFHAEGCFLFEAVIWLFVAEPIVQISWRPRYQEKAHGAGYDVCNLSLSGVRCTAQREIFTRKSAYFTL